MSEPIDRETLSLCKAINSVYGETFAACVFAGAAQIAWKRNSKESPFTMVDLVVSLSNKVEV